MNRRRFLATTALASTGFLVGAGVARAFSIEEPAATLAQQYRDARALACGGPDADHARMIAEVRALLAGEPLSEDEVQDRLAATTCPLCGCSLGG